MSKLLTIQGIGPGELELLDAAGWSDLRALASADASNLAVELSKANSMLKLVRKVPAQGTVAGWIRGANDILEGKVAEIPVRTPLPGGRRKRSSAGGTKEEVPGTEPAPQKTAAAAESPVTETADVALSGGAIPEEEPILPAESATVPAENQDSASADEEALARVSGTVNFEADPDVMKLLQVAPVAVPIPARLLAGKGIRPTEIAIAPLLNQATGDLDIRIAPQPAAVPEPGKKAVALPQGGKEKNRPAPAASSISRPAAPAAKPAEPPVQTRKGIDVARIRTVEEFQGDAPPQKRSASRSGMEDERIALLRAPLAKTNKGKNPASRFFIKGVLHDRPLIVWFGGLFAVLLQLMVPLAIVAAPLLILADVKVKHFDWVPGWIIAFPIAVPVLGILYAMISAGAKCRVCGQRIYVPKSCLKNRKAHNAFYIGHIGALALHVMVFKWFNCTFCGTAIRIKK